MISGLLLFLASSGLAYVVASIFFEKNSKKVADDAYHAGFEAGLEKGQKDIITTALALEAKQVEEEAKFAESVKDMGYAISLSVENEDKKQKPKRKRKSSRRKTK